VILRGAVNTLLVVLATASAAVGHCEAQRVLHLSDGDSVLFLGSGQANVPNKPPGLLIDFNPLSSLRDTAALEVKALMVWQVLRDSISSASPAFVVLRATDRNPQQQGIREGHSFGFVVERRPDGDWYFYRDSLTIDQRIAALRSRGHT